MICHNRCLQGAARCSAAPAARAPARLPVAARAKAASTTDIAAVQTTDVSAKEVASLLDTLTQPDMSIAELHLEMGDFEIRVRRNLTDDASSTAPAAAVAAAAAAPSTATVLAPAPHMEPALRLAPMAYQSADEDGLDSVDDEALLYVTANRVGVFRKGRSKAKVGDQVRKGEVLGCIEQLGTVVDVKCPQEGEIVAYKVADGDPVEYGGHIVALAPYFNLEDAGKTQMRGLN